MAPVLNRWVGRPVLQPQNVEGPDLPTGPDGPRESPTGPR